MRCSCASLNLNLEGDVVILSSTSCWSIAWSGSLEDQGLENLEVMRLIDAVSGFGGSCLLMCFPSGEELLLSGFEAGSQ